MPRFSIITVCRNAEEAVLVTGVSLREQTCEDYEWLVVDGASTDGTLAAVTRLETKSTRVNSEPDGGIYDAMNKGLHLARGEWVYFLNAGDAFADPQVLAHMVASMQAHPEIDLWWGDMVYFDAARELTLTRRFAHIRRSNLVFYDLNHQATFARRSLFEQVGAFNLDFCTSADYDWFLRVFASPARIQYLRRLIGRFQMGGAHSASPAALLRERDALRRQYIGGAALKWGLRWARLCRRWRLVAGHGG